VWTVSGAWLAGEPRPVDLAPLSEVVAA